MALDESYYNLSNLQNKIQKHFGFEAEVAANKSRLVAINTEGEELCSRGHFARRTWPASGLTFKTQASGRGRDCTRPTPPSSTCTAWMSLRLVTKNHKYSPEIKVTRLNPSFALDLFPLLTGDPDQLGEGVGVFAKRVESDFPRP